MTLECDKKKLKLFKIEVEDLKIQENFKRIQLHSEAVCRDLKTLEVGDGGDGGDTIINVNGAWTKGADVIPASTTKVIDTIALANFHGLDHILVMSNDVEGKTKRLQLTTVKEGATLSTSVHGRLGTLSAVLVDSIVNAGNAEIQITNNNIFDINVSYAKLTL